MRPMWEIRHGDCLELMRAMPDNSVDAVVTDPPYGLSFMGKKWDYDVPSTEVWAECLRVLKPGGHLLAFAGTRTQHRMAVRIEDGGFEIRDMIAWVYGSGFPKSLDVSKAIDKAAGAEREVVGSGKGRTGAAAQPNGGSSFSDDSYQWPGDYDITAPATDAARQWQGWGTALKPSMEPVTVARKPLVGTVAENVLEHGTGALNIDGCRVEADWANDPSMRGVGYGFTNDGFPGDNGAVKFKKVSQEWRPTQGRWPANLIHDGSEEAVGLFPQTAKSSATLHPGTNRGSQFGQIVSSARTTGYSDTGSAARFFYCAKVSRTERNKGLDWFDTKEVKINKVQNRPCANCGGWSPNLAKYRPQSCCACGKYEPVQHRTTASKNFHPTVKPIALMRYLVRLATPPGGTVLDPFTGSGSTGIACKLEGFNFIGCERDPEYIDIARARIDAWQPEPEVPKQGDLFA